LRVTVACSPREGVAAEVALELAEGATAIEAIRASGLLVRFAELDLSVQAIGVWGRTCALDAGCGGRSRSPAAAWTRQAQRLRAQRAPARSRR
jgi:putative ubiquitin-RnfH superfamily antitoxin RatB of RatAB toxin-antitoxin module